jgi:hypothetical protein
MGSTVKVPLGGATYNRKWYMDVNTGTYAAPTWTGVFGVVEFKPKFTPSQENDSDFDHGGAKLSTVSAYEWGVDLKLDRKTKAADATAYDVGQEVLRAASNLLGDSNKVDIRYYEVTSGGPKVQAYRGYVGVVWDDDGGNMEAKSYVSVTLFPKSERTAITHPDAAGVVPVLYSVSPAVGVQAGGTQHVLTGSGFFAAGVAAVASMKLGVTDVPTFSVLNDNQLVFVAPAKAAGPFVIYVTNGTGESVTATVTITVT